MSYLSLRTISERPAARASFRLGVVFAFLLCLLGGIRSGQAQTPSNDNFANAPTIGGFAGVLSGSTVGATRQAGEPEHLGFASGHSVWYFWTAPATRGFAFFTENSSFDTVTGIYTGNSVSSLTRIVVDDDSGTGGSGLESRAQFSATAGTTYRIVVDGFADASGTFTLRWGEAAGAPIITSPRVASGTVGQQFIYQLEASDADARAASNLPSGLSYNTTLNAIVGSPAQAGTFSVNLLASNRFGAAQATLALTVRTPPATGPRIVSSSSATGRTGRRFSFQVVTTGGTPSTRLAASGLPAGLSFDAMSGRISGTPVADGSTPVTLTVTDGNLSSSSILQLTFTSNLAIPVIVSSNEARVAAGQPFNYRIDAPSDGGNPPVFTLIGNLPAGLGFDPGTGTISGTFTASVFEARSHPLSGGIVSNVQLFATNANGTTTIPLDFFRISAGVANISTRLAVGTGANVLIGGFIIQGNAPKQVIIRAVGPSLPLAGTLSDPRLELFAGGTALGSNDDWRATQEQEIIDSELAPRDNRESAILATLSPGAYTAIVSGKEGATGIALVEIFDRGTASLESSSNSTLANLSTRGFVQTGDNVMIGGFIITGGTTKVIVRATGPQLANFGVPGALNDTTIDLFGANGQIAANDDWRASQQQEIINSGLQPAIDRESAIIAALPPGGYTAIVRGKNGTSGVGLIEVYVLR